jgi:glucokinase
MARNKNICSPLILAGDVGGTHTRLGLFRPSGALVRQRTYTSADYEGLVAIIEDFCGEQCGVAAASFGVAGPVFNGAVIATNLPWKITESSLKRRLSISRVRLINDLVANAYGIEAMDRKDFIMLNKGINVHANRALLSAGTGLGAAVLFWNGQRHVPSPSEGGHVEFGPRNSLELGLLSYCFERFGHVSYERLLSGSGLFTIYEFLRYRGTFGTEPAWLTRKLAQEDPAAVIANAGMAGKCRLCSEALDLFVSIYGAAAGNLALQVMALGGMYIGGGIAPRISAKLRDGTFMRAFQNKGRLASIVKRIPVKIIMNDQAALLGAAAYASSQLTAAGRS